VRKNKKGGPFGGRPFLEIVLLFQDGSGHLTHVMIGALLRTFHFATELDNLFHALTS
jgi:hypothetical protein